MTHNLGARKKVVYGLLLAAAVTGLLIDRLHPRSGPASARADAVTAGAVPPPSPARDGGPPLAAIFEKPLESGPPADPPSAFRDGFAVTDAVRRACEPQEARDPGGGEGGQAGAAEPVAAAEAFRAAHRLRGTVLRGGQARALVDDRLLTPGDELDGFRLERIEDYRAVFVRGRERVILELPRPGES